MKHEFTKEIGEEYFCSNHYCDGHKDTFIVCSCGWKIKDYSSHDRPDWLDVQKTKHVLQAEGLM